MVTVRRAAREDAGAIATIRVETWRVAYDGLVDDVLLHRLDIEQEAQRRALHWDERHVDPRAAELIAEVEGDAVGWAVAGPSQTPNHPRTGQLYALYVLPAHWSTGVGHALMTAAEDALRAAGFETAVLWVLHNNTRAAAFYERHGWVEDGTVKLDEEIVGNTDAAPLRELRRVRDLRIRI